MKFASFTAVGVFLMAACSGTGSGTGTGSSTGTGSGSGTGTGSGSGSGSGTGSGPAFTLAELAKVATQPDTIAAMAKAGGAQTATMAWDVFLYLNWPAVGGERGVPDPGKSLGATPVVWQSWKEVHEVYLAGGAQPPTWSDGGPKGPPTLSLTMIDGKTLVDVDGNPITYTVGLNQDAFGYVFDRQLYGWAGQAALRQAGAKPVQFPPAAMEIKASWKILDPVADKDRMSHYLVAPALLPSDGGGAPTKVTVGLTGLHVTSKALPDWVWMTFEQVENPTTTGVTAVLPIDPAVAQVNAQMQAALTGTPWAYYQLMGVQTAFTTGDGTPTLLANTQIETYFQSSSSCMTCHARASISTGPVARLPFFIMKAGNLAGPTGTPDLSPFGPAKGQFSSLDSVWSLREAKQAVSP